MMARERSDEPPMTNPIDRATLTVRETAPRMTPIPASRRFGEVLAQSGRALLQGALSAAAFVPGGNLLSAAVRGAGLPGALGNSPGISGGTGSGSSVVGVPNFALQASPEGPGTNPAASGGSDASPSATGATPGASGTGTDGDDILTRGQEQSVRMLRLQEAISEENRRYTALSNVLHARHEMAKNAIGNIR